MGHDRENDLSVKAAHRRRRTNRGTRDVLEQENVISCWLITKIQLSSDWTWNVHNEADTEESTCCWLLVSRLYFCSAERKRDVETPHLFDVQQTICHFYATPGR